MPFAAGFFAIALSVATVSAGISESRAESGALVAPMAPAPIPSVAAAVHSNAPVAATPTPPPSPVAAAAAPTPVSVPAPVAEPTPAAEPAYTMRTYIVGFLRRGPKWTPEKTAETAKIQEGHMANIQRMAATGKLILAGPFSDSGDLRGMFVFDLTDIEEARAMAEQDPAVQAGRLVIDLHPWYSASGIRSDATAPAPAPKP